VQRERGFENPAVPLADCCRTSGCGRLSAADRRRTEGRGCPVFLLNSCNRIISFGIAGTGPRAGPRPPVRSRNFPVKTCSRREEESRQRQPR